MAELNDLVLTYWILTFTVSLILRAMISYAIVAYTPVRRGSFASFFIKDENGNVRLRIERNSNFFFFLFIILNIFAPLIVLIPFTLGEIITAD